MTRQGNALRFLAIVVVGWTALRIVMLSTVAAPIEQVTLAGPARPTRGESPSAPSIAQGPLLPAMATQAHQSSSWTPVSNLSSKPSRQTADPARVALALLGMINFAAVKGNPTASVASASVQPRPADFPLLPAAIATMRGEHNARWSGSAWLVIRGGQGLGAGLTTSQIGGGQAGARLAYALGDARRLALVGRFATPLAGRGKQAAIGAEWQPTRLPMRLTAEQRLAIDGGGGGPALGIIGGIGPTGITRDFRLEAYGQAGVIKQRRVIGYADGAVRVGRRVAMLGGTAIDLGAGSWGAAQPGAARLDLGPSVGVRVPVGSEHVRLSLDWRQRVAGDARPGSGAVLSLGADF